MIDTGAHRRQHIIHHRHRGAIMVITLIAIILLAGMVFYVINLGRQANARIVAQHSADATAAAGAGWIARAFNTVAMNNVSIARSIVNVDVLDSMPMAMQFTREDLDAATIAMEGQLSRGVPDQWVRDAFEELRNELQAELAMVIPLDQFFNQQYDVRHLTFYDGPDGRGMLWRAMEAMDEFSQASMENIGVLAQLNAMRGGEVNMERDAHTSDEDAMAVMLPVMPQFAWKRGIFDDFERPVRLGLLPVGVDDKVTNRGPFDTVYGWRFGRIERMEGYTDPNGGTSASAPGGGGPRVPFGPGPGGSGTYVVTDVDWENYGVEGPLTWVLTRIDEMIWARHLLQSRFGRLVRELATIKMSYCWPGDDIKTIIDPDWVTEWSKAVSIAEEGTPTIQHTAFFRCAIKSVHPRGHAQFMSPGTWTYIYATDDVQRFGATVLRASGWHDPRNWYVKKLADHIWSDEWDYNVFFDQELGLAPGTDQNGQPIVHTVYRIDEYAFAGIDIGEPVEVRNPFNFTSKGDLPAPLDFDHTQVKTDDASRRAYLTFLTAAQRQNRSLFWTDRFDANKPYPYTVGLTQVAVFNNHSWDLWTQMWHAQIERISDYDEWMARLPDLTAEVGSVPDLDAQKIDELSSYLKTIEPLADMMLMH